MNTTLPLSAPAAAAFAQSSVSFWTRIWTALEAHGQRRAAAELRRLALIHAPVDAALSRDMRTVARRIDAA